MSILKLTYPAGIVKEYHSTNLHGSKLNGIRPIRIDILVEVDKQSLEKLVADFVTQINQYCGEIFYLGSKVWSRK